MMSWLSLLAVPWLLTAVAADVAAGFHHRLRGGDGFERRMQGPCANVCNGPSIPECITAPSTYPTSPTVFDLFAAQSIDVGSVLVSNDDETITVTYKIAEGTSYCLTETHLEVFNCADVDVGSESPPEWLKKGNPAPGRFSYKEEHQPCATEFTYEVDITDGINVDPDDSVCVAAHAVVTTIQGGFAETAWGGDQEFWGENWALYIRYTIPAPLSPPVCYTTTAPANTMTAGNVRFKDFRFLSSYSGNQVYLGAGNLDDSMNRVEVQTHGWRLRQGSTTCIPVTLVYDPTGTGTLTTTWYRGSPLTQQTLETYDVESKPVSPPGDAAATWSVLDGVSILARNSYFGAVHFIRVWLTAKGVTTVLGDFCQSPDTVYILNLDLSGGFTIEGDILVSHPESFGSNEGSKVQFGAINSGEY